MDVCSGILAATSVQIDGQVRLLTIEFGKNARSVTYFHFFKLQVITTSDIFIQECLAKAMPHSMMEHEIKKGKPKAKGKPHLADLCGMCSTGKPCKIVRDNQLPDVSDALVRVSLTG